jgi:tetratricopeptide (TPR) repeat protein
MLDWGLGQLGATGKERSRVSYEVLMKRYVEGLSNSKYADLMFIADDTAHARRKSAIGKLTKILQKEEQAPAEGDKRKQALIGLRYGACDEEEQRLLRLLAIFPTLVARELLIRIENVNVERDSWSLMSQNLLVMDQVSIQVGIHPEIRPYIVTLLTADEWQRWHLAASCYDEQEGKLMEALYHLQQAGEHERAAALLVGQAHELGARLPIEPLRVRLAEFERDTLSGNRWAQVKILAGRTAEVANDVEIAFSQYEQALGAEDQTIRAQAYYRLACLYEQRDIETAFIHYAKCQKLLDNLEARNSIELLAKVHIRVAWLLVQHNFGQNHALQHTGNAEANLRQAETLLERESLLLAGEVEQEWHRLRSDLHTTWATLLAYQEEPNPQMQHQHRWLAWQHAREAQDVEQMINTPYNLGTMYFWRADYAQAQSHFKESRSLSIEAGNERMVALNHKGIGGCYFSGAADYEKAVAHYKKAYHYFK